MLVSENIPENVSEFVAKAASENARAAVPGKEEYELFATCLVGLERVLADELKSLGVSRVRPLGGGVAFFCDEIRALRVCLWSRLASRVTLIVGRVAARDADALYAGARSLPWEWVVLEGASVAVHAHGTNEQLRNTKFTALKVKDALCDRLREVQGTRPDVDTRNPDALIEVRLRDGRATVSLDLSRETLYRRSYLSTEAGENAALSCGAAAGLLAMARWAELARAGGCLLDPVCDSGVLACEAAGVACDLAPGLLRADWGFFGWARYDEQAWNALLDEADGRFERGLTAHAEELSEGKSAGEKPKGGKPKGKTSGSGRFECVRVMGACKTSSVAGRARSLLKRAGLQRVVRIEPVSAEEVLAAMKSQPQVVKAGMLVASALHAHGASSDARLVADAMAFVAGCAAAPEGARFAAVGDGDAASMLSMRFGVKPLLSVELGRERIAMRAMVFEERPQAVSVIMLPDAAGGAPQAVRVCEGASEQFAARLRKNAKERRKWARREGVSCYRVYDADLPDYNVAIDVYEGAGQASGATYLHVAEYQAPSSVDAARAQCRFEDVLALAPEVLGVSADRVFSKVRRREKGGGQYRDAGRQSFVTWTQEDGYLFELDLSGYLDTGLFLDHRLTRELVGKHAKGARFLNLFAYTGSATVHAAGAGAVETTTVDLSQTYLDWARRNMELNGFSGPEHAFVRSDVMTFVTETRRRPLRYDLIFVDPPTFSNSKAMGTRTWDVQRDHVELLIGVSRLLAPGGVAIFSCNLRTFKMDETSLAKYGVAVKDITGQTIPHDFERNPKIHQCYLVARAR